VTTYSGLGVILIVVGVLLILLTTAPVIGWVLLVLGIILVVFGFTPYGGPGGRRRL
jgi:sulfite exporter TauE/SafE